MMALLITAKLKDQGYELAADRMDWLVEKIEQRLSQPGGGLSDSTFQIDDSLPDGRHFQISFDAEDVERFSDKVTDAITAAIEAGIEPFFRLTMDSVQEQADEAVQRRAEEMEAFRRRLLARWAKPLRLLAVQIGLAIQYGADRNTWLRQKATTEDGALIEALTRLHARACQVAGEVEVLLQGGFADGALSRWRTLHEITIVAFFIQEKGNGLAERYLDHLEIDSLATAKKFKQASEKLGYADITDEELQNLQEAADRLKAKHGDEFGSVYGWAFGAISNPTKRPTFADIEEAVQFEKLRPFYKLASTTVHAGPKGAFWKLGILPSQSQTLLAGPSNAGLAEAGRLTAMSLGQVSMPLMLLHPLVDSNVWGRVIIELSNEIEEAFLAAERKLADEDSGGWHRRVKVPERVRKEPGQWPKRLMAQSTELTKPGVRVSRGMAAVQTSPKRRSGRR